MTWHILGKRHHGLYIGDECAGMITCLKFNGGWWAFTADFAFEQTFRTKREAVVALEEVVSRR